MEKCIFCEIAIKRMPAKVVYEDDYSIAFLDINPRSKGMTIVAAKKHYTVPSEDTQTTMNIFRVAIAIEGAIRKALDPLDVSMAVMPSPMNHFHVRLYPVYKDQMPIGEGQPMKTTEEELNDVVMKISSAGIKVEKAAPVPAEQEPEVEEEPEDTRTKKDIDHIRREIESG